MSIFKFSDVEWKRVEDEKETYGFKWEKISEFKGLIPCNQFWKDLKLKKSQKGFKCICCDKQLPKGTRCIGNTYERICYCCFKEWIDNSNKTLSNIQDYFNDIQKELSENKGMWDRELIINNLSD